MRGVSLSPQAGAALAAVLTVLGIATIWSSSRLLYGLWTTDALKSIGMVVPAVSALLIWRAWKSIGWEMDGSWWGLALIAGIAILDKMREQSILILVLGPEWSIYVPPASLVIFAYGVGVVLLFGGKRLFRAALFPLLLLLLVNPVPHLFNVYVDLPLQRASAHVARGFAMALGQPLSPDKLRLMFTPDFGMFIAPGCNGIRGAVTMGMIALVAGYLYRFRWKAHAVVVFGAILLGYIFNFVRLCVLVLYYLVALHFPTLQDKAENADYVIGAVLFFMAVYLLYVAIQRLGAQPGNADAAAPPPPPLESDEGPLGGSFYLRTAALSILVCAFLIGVVGEMTAPGPSEELKADETALGQFPDKVNNFSLVRRWNENLLGGALLFHWAEYAPDGGGSHVDIGISPVLGSHDTLICHSARGEDPIWHSQQTFNTGSDGPTAFSASFFNDGATQYFEASTLCNGNSCGEYSSPRSHFGFVYSKPHPGTLLSLSAERPIPILLRAETIDTTLPPVVARQQLGADISAFLSGVSLNELTRPYRRR